MENYWMCFVKTGTELLTKLIKKIQVEEYNRFDKKNQWMGMDILCSFIFVVDYQEDKFGKFPVFICNFSKL